MERRRQRPPHQPGRAAGRHVRECSAGRAQTGLSDGRQHGAEQQQEDELQRAPVDAQRGQPGQDRNHQMPLGRLRQRREQARRGLVERLIRRNAPDTVVDARPAPAERAGEPVPVDAAGPADVARAVVFLGPLALQHRLGPAVPDLLLPVGAHGIPPVVPDHGGRAEAERPAPLLQPPAYVHVITGGAKLRIEPADGLEAGFPERHVAAGDVLRLVIGKEDMHGTARRPRHALRDQSVPRRREVRSAHRRVRGAHERGREIGEPLRVGVGVVVDVGDDLSRGRFEPRVARARQAAVPGPDEPAVVLPRDGGRRVGGAVVHDDDLVVGVGELLEPLEAVADRARPVARADDDGNARPGEGRGERHVREGLAHGAQCRLGPPVPAREAEGPVVHVGSGAVPLVGPGVHERPGAPRRERAAHLPVERARLDGLAVPPAVEPDLAHHERALARMGLQPGEVGAQPLLRLEIDVVADEVQEIEL